MSELQEKLDAAIWSAHTLFQKGLVSGSTGNISFLHEHRMYISRSGSCFGRLRQEDFAQVDMQGTILYGKPSKEYPMHLALYRESEEYKAVIHTHSFYASVLSCYTDTESHVKNLFAYTPYLYMQTKGNIPCVAYAPPAQTRQMLLQLWSTDRLIRHVLQAYCRIMQMLSLLLMRQRLLN